MTEARYLDDAEQYEFEATVEAVRGTNRVVLDRTYFYPTGGGQPHDTGTLATDDVTWDVTDVQKRDRIEHVVAGDAPEPGTTVTGHVDPERRRAHTRYHTTQHLLSATLLDEFDAETTGNQLYTDRAHLDCAYDRFDGDDLQTIEAHLNDLVSADLPVRWYTLDRAEAEATLDPERTRLHLLPDSIREVRIVEIGDEDDPFDRTACAGTHVKSTGEIGTVVLTGRTTQGTSHERVEFILE
ncbi:alanyl-tRNA editing protein [Haloferax mediterranei ATCC 33500]|uniref:Alanine--tRNA ligase n=1 Tax=Haloferax mediterranei (strain ATCC 33500 / DSM 1411 / JCM 8866 / NBRC 14739 / NCIMB 2177 / R-4) TaxID=523841 RepID=I3R2V1_HALMT|nr:alanyl-tRNA editing protein [Haloferax mediterranei]AFK18561.2 alanine--tRNA ligase [Haloferax mediterranei ATCC 33500]AHZ22062.1 threonyl-tRNA synthetase [Haloferax mediterranei ATCC 33500]EMA02163.1 alanine--tRNA ligase [Haloferax mediterranei ATCC 33500]MDX5988650.1 alanyl-tRNA editing protein [Haloferax mediterranei ATCC 33500]QCQ75063.1 alanyl-tRNA editing protein [Haloferax mediterranei ATCC 33500]